jgi:uncharacterized membrane protein
MNQKRLAVAVLALGLMVSGCRGDSPPPPPAPLDELPLSLVGDLFQGDYVLAAYHQVDFDRDGRDEALAVLTQYRTKELSFLSDTYVVLFHRDTGVWTHAGGLRMDGERATTELRDLTQDGIPELIVSTEETRSQRGDFIAPWRTAGFLSVFTYTPDKQLVEMGDFSSSLLGQGRDYPKLGLWEDNEAIKVARDLRASEGPLWQPYQEGSYVWDGSEFALAQTEDMRRLSPLISWVLAKNAPWASVFFILGGVLGGATLYVSQRSPLQDKWLSVWALIILVAGGIGLGSLQEWLCVPAPILAGLIGLLVGRRIVRGGSS